MKTALVAFLFSALACAQQGRVVHYDVKPSELKYTFSASYAPVAHLKSGDILETNTVDCFGNAVQKPGDTLSMAPGDNPLTGPFYIDGAEPGDTLAVKILDLQIDSARVRCDQLHELHAHAQSAHSRKDLVLSH